MATEQFSVVGREQRGVAGSVVWVILIPLAAMLLMAHFAQVGPSDRIANPAVSEALRPVGYEMGRTDWTTIMNYIAIINGAMLTLLLAWAWTRWPAHPLILMAFATTAIVWQDPVMNWSPYAIYDPKLWHWPDWYWSSVSPTVEPYIVFLYATFYLAPYFPAIWILRRLQKGASMNAFVWRHPLISLGVLTYLCGFAIDAMTETFLIKTGIFFYSQVIPWGSLMVGTPFQFPLIWESSLITTVMVAPAILLYRDDTGRTQAEKLAQRLRMFHTRPALATFLVMFGVMNVAYFMYGGGFLIIRAGHMATAVACPWPYPESKVYDPNSYYEQAGSPGPYLEGRWNTWISAQPSGRPAIAGPVRAGSCGPGHP